MIHHYSGDVIASFLIGQIPNCTTVKRPANCCIQRRWNVVVIKCMHKQWIPGSPSPLPGEPVYEAT